MVVTCKQLPGKVNRKVSETDTSAQPFGILQSKRIIHVLPWNQHKTTEAHIPNYIFLTYEHTVHMKDVNPHVTLFPFFLVK